MAKIYHFLSIACLLLLSVVAKAQSDTLFFLNFETEEQLANMYPFPDPGASDTLWINYDEDGLTTATADPSNFFWAADFELDTTILDSNAVAMSQSYLTDFDTSSSNWLISPAYEIVDDKATLHWKSAAFQGPRYLDGYAVKILTGSQDFTTADVTEVFRAAEMLSWLQTGDTLDLSAFVFSNGYIHADSFKLTQYFTPGNPDDASPAHSPRLEPHSISLAAFEGQTIYVAFHHDSSDDYYFEFDDLLLMGTKPVSGVSDKKANDIRFVTYPNPADNFLNVMFVLEEPAEVQLEIVGQHGNRVGATPKVFKPAGDFSERIDLRSLPSGAYSVVLSIDNQRFVKNLIRR